MNKLRMSVLIAALAATAVGGWVVANRRPAEGAAPPSPPPAVPVTAGSATAQNVPIFAQGLGTVTTINTVNVKTRVDGQVMKVFFVQGQEVKEGDPLFLIDPRPFQAALDQAEANQQKDQAQLQGAQLDLERFGKLVGSGFQTRQSYDDQKATVGQLEGAVKADAAAIEAAKLNLQYAAIRAPISGRTGELMVDEGNFVQAVAGTTLVSITQIKPVYVNFTLPQDLVGQIRAAQAKAPLVVQAYDGSSQKLLASGQLSFIDNHVDTSTGTLAMEGTFANDNEQLWPGEFVTVRLILGTRPDAVTVPVATVMTGASGFYIYVIKPDGTVQRRTVTVAARQDGIAVIAKGVNAGEKVVVGGQYRLTNNTRVKIEPAGAT